MKTETFEGIRLRNLEVVHPKVKALLVGFYETQMLLAVEREDYEQAALWRDAANGTINTVSVATEDNETWVITANH